MLIEEGPLVYLGGFFLLKFKETEMYKDDHSYWINVKSDYLTSEEKAFILDSLKKLKEKKMHLSVPVNIIRSYAIKYKQEYLLN